MRWIFLTLVTINLLLLAFFWQNKQPPLVPVTPVSVEVTAQGKTLVLVSELEKPLPTLARSTVATPPVERIQRCYSAGPFSEELNAKYLLARANALNFTGSVNTLQIEANKPAEYWVFVPPRISRDEALRTLRELQKRKLDSYIITQGEMAEGVSLGLFRNKESAYSLQKQVQSYGIPSTVRVLNDSANEYWVEINESAELNEQLRERIRASDTQVRWELVECKKK